MEKKNYIAAAIVVVLVALGWYWYAKVHRVPKTQTEPMVEQKAPHVDEAVHKENQKAVASAPAATRFTLKGEYDGQPLTELLKSNMPATIEARDYGQALTAVGKRAANKYRFWAVYVNGEFVAKGLETVTLKKGDTVRVVLEYTERRKGM